jgi:hypothetical protein
MRGFPLKFLQGLTGLPECLLHEFFHLAQDMARSGTRLQRFQTSPDSQLVAMGKMSTQFERSRLGDTVGIRFRVEFTSVEGGLQEHTLEFLLDDRATQGALRPCGMPHRTVPAAQRYLN